MPKHQQKSSLAARPSPAAQSTPVQREEAASLQLQRFLQNPTASPQMMRAVQHQIGNQALQRLMRQSQPDTAARQKTPRSIQRVGLVQHRTGHGSLQRNPFTWIKNKFKKWVNNQATEATFGTDAERQAAPTEKLMDVEANNKRSFSKIDMVDIPSGARGEHILRGRHYLAKDPSKGAYAGKTVLFLSGSGGIAEDYSKESAIYYCKEGANLLAVNYRGFGRSTTTDGVDRNRKMGHNELKDTMLYEDSRSMFNWLRGTGVAADQVIIQGYSLGGAMAANLVSSLANDGIRVAGLVFQSAIDSARKVAVRSQGSFLGGIGADNLGSEFDTVGAMKAFSKAHPEMLDMPIAVFSGAQAQGDHLDDNTTNLSGELKGTGFSNVGSVSRHDKSHAPDHLKSLTVQDVVKQQLGEAPKKKEAEERMEQEVVKL